MITKTLKSLITNNKNRRLLALIKDNWFRLFLAMACMMVIALATSATAFLVKPALDDIFFNKDIKMLTLIPIVVVIIYLLRGLGMYGQAYLMNYVGESVIRRLRNSLYDHIQDLPVSFFYKEKTGVLMSRITNDVGVIKGMVSTAVTGALKDTFTIVGLIMVIFYRDWKMALFAFIVLPIAFIPVVEFGRRVRKISTGCQETIADLNSFLHETFAGNKIVKAFGMERYEKKRFHEKALNLFNLEMKSIIASSLSSPIMEVLAGTGIAFIIWYGGSKVISGESTTGTFFSFMAAVLMLYDPVKKLSGLNNAIQQGLAASDRVFAILDRKSEIAEDDNPVEIQFQSHNVTFDNVFFKYDKEMVLKNINFDVKAGEILALVGMSGGGKTSLVNLIPRFYDVTRGAILVDGIDIRKASISSLRKQIAIVTQEPILFNDTVKNNIAYGNQSASQEDIENAAKAAYAYGFIESFPDKYDTIIGELGARLSGGEKQRICIARALLKNAPILILDEATSALDTESEMLVQKALENLMQGRTTFVIAHRLSTIDYADRIIVVVDGHIVEEGKQEELIANQGEYYKLYSMQFSNN
ncbi:MAG: ABC transporter ATP-binding protein, partial [Deltaproteobacteria bacterium]|nr:ABC transporter ATP-binding protein [Deltaproteobacteria bacterium]